MGFLSTTKVVTEPKTMTREELIELRDAIADGRNYGAISVTLAGLSVLYQGHK